jgi:hypothetical protein
MLPILFGRECDSVNAGDFAACILIFSFEKAGRTIMRNGQIQTKSIISMMAWSETLKTATEICSKSNPVFKKGDISRAEIM